MRDGSKEAPQLGAHLTRNESSSSEREVLSGSRRRACVLSMTADRKAAFKEVLGDA